MGYDPQIATFQNLSKERLLQSEIQSKYLRLHSEFLVSMRRKPADMNNHMDSFAILRIADPGLMSVHHSGLASAVFVFNKICSIGLFPSMSADFVSLFEREASFQRWIFRGGPVCQCFRFVATAESG